MKPEEAIEIIAHHVVVQGASRFVETHGWEAYPDIGEHDWNRVVEKVVELTPDVDFDEAYRVLSKRANNEQNP